MKHTQTATVREMRTLTNTCQKHAESAWRAKDTAEQAASSTRFADRSATADAGQADAACLEAKDDAKDAERFAKRAAEALLAIIIILLVSILADVATRFFFS